MDGWISVAWLNTLDKITSHTATGAAGTTHYFLLLDKWLYGSKMFHFFMIS